MKKERKGSGGRPPYAFVPLFKILVLAPIFDLSDDRTGYQSNDRMSFMRFLGLELWDRVPDAKTIRLFQDTLTKANVMEDLFAAFHRMLEAKGVIIHKGTIADATFVDAPRQRNSRRGNQTIKDGETPEDWLADTPKARRKPAQKDADARRTVKNKALHYGCKDHAKADFNIGLTTTSADTLFWTGSG